MSIVIVLLLAGAADLNGQPIRLFDGETTFGWTVVGEARVEKGKLVLGGTKETTAYPSIRFGHARVRIVGVKPAGGRLRVGDKEIVKEGAVEFEAEVKPAQDAVRITVPAGKTATLSVVELTPLGMRALFDGKSLKGWKPFAGDAKREKSRFTVEEGILRVKDGPGDLATESTYDDFVLQVTAKTHGKHLNSGIFFRAIPGQYQNGYEAQIHHDFTAEPARKYVVDQFDPKTNKPAGKREVLSPAKDFGTGAIYRRIPARKAVAKDSEWFTLTVVARGRQIATWVDGVQQVDWTDHRAASDNPRTGYREAAGTLSLQGHDPTTDLSFRAIQIASIPKK
jgi:hypothetical protein